MTKWKMNNILKDIGSSILKRIKQPSSASSLAVLFGYMGISNSIDLSNAICTFIVSGLSIYGILKDDGSK